MEKPVLVIMAAGMGSRYGGLKQIDPVDEYGNIIMDFSVFDALEAGFEKVILIIKKENEADFMGAVGNRLASRVELKLAYQSLTDMPEGIAVPDGRVKPWGTAHAVLSCREEIRGPFAVINADDYYGKAAFREIYRFLTEEEDDVRYHYAMVGYRVENTLTENGTVSRGVCRVDERGNLIDVTERQKIRKDGDGASYTEDGGASWEPIAPGTVVSMNLWGFGVSFMKELKARFPVFLSGELPVNPQKCEYFLPAVVSALLEEGKADVRVLASPDKWFGVTYKEDRENVVKAIRAMKDAGLYPEKLWQGI
ncbi:MAG: nucleotidyltransferase [Lachnospiraceae bacterium]|nr:nucleotidyltransferase [Lachnospiraceae bacterium]